MFWRVRSYWVATAAVAYVSFAALKAAGGVGLGWLALTFLPLALAAAWRLTADPPRVGLGGPRTLGVLGADPVEPAARTAARACFAGTAILLAARCAPGGPGFTALANLGVAIASMGALVALARVGSLGGLLEPPPATRRLDAAAFASLLWTVAIALPAARSLSPSRTALLDDVAIDYATVAASSGSLGISIVAAFRLRDLRRLELGVGDRAWAALCLAITALAIGVLASIAGVARPERLLPLTALTASLCIALAAVTREAPTLSRALRTVLALATLAAPVALFAVYVVTQAAPQLSGPVVFLACVASTLAGLTAPLLARRFAPAGARWLDAFDAATRAAMNPDPDLALETALGRLREAVGFTGSMTWKPPGRKRSRKPIGLRRSGTSTSTEPKPKERRKRGRRRAEPEPWPDQPPRDPAPALYRLSPPEMVTVDRAGYVQVNRTEVPARLVELADLEPERILRTEAARAVEVRRPEVRPLIDWLDRRAIAAVAVVRDDTGPIGLIAIPGGARTSPMSLEEARGLRQLADRFGAVLGVSSMLARSRRRELESRTHADELRAEITRLGSALAASTVRVEALARNLERPARVATYSPAARATIEELERVAATGAAVTLLTAPGIDAVAWAALVHLASARRSGVLVIVDGTRADEHDLMRWRDPASSPLEVASGGTLVVLDVHALPLSVQSYIGAALAERAGIVVTTSSTVDSLVGAGRMDERLADRLGDRAVALPVLSARAEDLRALAVEHLSRIGLRLKGVPFGLDVQALAMFVEHAWPGNDAELESVLLRAALLAEGEVVGMRELGAIGFFPTRLPRASDRPEPDVAISIGRRRRSTRPR